MIGRQRGKAAEVATRLIKHGHACVRVDNDGEVLVIDPGGYTEPTALDGADAVLITHEHPDHFLEARIRSAAEANPALRIWASPTVSDALSGLAGRVTRVGDGDTFTAAGLSVEAHGTWHAEIHPDLPRVLNTGYLIGGSIFHPGDALTVPDREVATLLLPVHAPWSRIADVIDYVRAVGAQAAYAVHDGLLNDNGLGIYASMLGERGPGTATPYTRLAPGESIEL
jgi:L-ascorbate metabolism protein UlaG (beta-lactamase superfamily)